MIDMHSGEETGDETAEADVPCPRCGHDLRGLTTNEGSGVCPECGLDVSWEELQLGRDRHPWWSIERRGGLFGFAGRAVPQCFMAAVRPRGMLRKLRLEHRPRVGRVFSLWFLLVIAVAVAPMVTFALETLVDGAGPGIAARAGISVYRDGYEWERRVPEAAPGRAIWLVSGRIVERPAGGAEVGAATLSDLIVARGGWITGLVPRPEAPPGNPNVLAIPIFDGRVAHVDLDAAWANTMIVGADIRFLSDVERIVRTGRVQLAIYPSQSRTDEVIDAAARYATGFLGIPFGLLVAIPAFVLLPTARRRASVRAHHLVRLAAYALLGGTLLMIPGVIVSDLLDGPTSLDQLGRLVLDPWGRPNASDAEFAGLVVAVMGPALFVSIPWWSWAAGHHLRMSRAWAVGASVAIVGILSIGLPLLIVALATGIGV